MIISTELIRRKFVYNYYLRAMNYKKRVHDLTVVENNGGYDLTAEVDGSEIFPYEVTLYIRNVGGVYFNGDCSCPVGNNCKHVIAAILVAIDRKLFKEEDPVVKRRRELDRWLEKVNALKSAQNIKVQKRQAVVYVLSESAKQGVLLLEMMVHRQLKKGGFGKASGVKLNGYNYPEYFTDQDIEMADLFDKIQEGYHVSSIMPLEGAMGKLLLDKAINTGACVLEDSQGEIVTRADALSFKPEWYTLDSDRLELRFTAEKVGAQLIVVEPLMYINIMTAEVGLVKDLDFTTNELELMLEAPQVENEDAKYLSKKLLLDMPSTAIPPLVTDFITKISDLTPRFILNIDTQKYLFSATVEIKYGENNVQLVPPTLSEIVKQENERYIEIIRDNDREISEMERIKAMGLILQESDSAYLIQASYFGDRQGQLAMLDRFYAKDKALLEAAGWQINLDKTTELQFEAVENIVGHIDEENHWFDLRFDMNINGKMYNTIPIIASLLKSVDDISTLPDKLYLELGDGSVAVVEKKMVLPIIETLFELFDYESDSFKLNVYDAPVLTTLKNAAIDFSGSSKLLEIAQKLESFEGIEVATIPKGLKATLRDYQADGYSWLQFLRAYNFAGILADDMGLGKTIQTLTHLLKEKDEGRLHKPCLVVAPTSLMSNWKKEAARFTPELKLLVLQGMERKHDFDKVNAYDIVLTTYSLIPRDFDKYLEKSEFYYLVLDEAQNIKNYKSKAAQHLRALKTEHRLCLTGTPMENHLGELWGLFDFLMPGFLFNNKFFNENFRNPIEKDQDMKKQMLLNTRIKPFLLRRTKNEVATELPPKTEIIQTAPLGKKQAALYESIRVAMDKQVQDAIKDKGFGRSHIMILDALLKLRQVCCDPRLVKLERAKEVKESAKFEMLFDLLVEQLEEGRKILLFSQFTTMLTLIEERLKIEKISYSKLTGATRKREEAIEKFTSGEVPLFLISLKAGGVGLNLTQADTVIHYDPWWNPAAENQATDRAYRIGQDKPVFVYKLIVENTLEEKIVELQKRKQALADYVYKNKADAIGLSQDDLADLFKPLQG